MDEKSGLDLLDLINLLQSIDDGRPNCHLNNVRMIDANGERVDY